MIRKKLLKVLVAYMKTLTKSGYVTGSRIRIPPQSARLFIQSSELGPTSSPAGEGVPPLKGGDTLVCMRGGAPIWTRGQTLWYSRYMMYFGSELSVNKDDISNSHYLYYDYIRYFSFHVNILQCLEQQHHINDIIRKYIDTEKFTVFHRKFSSCIREL
jgi:hypothetical protein